MTATTCSQQCTGKRLANPTDPRTKHKVLHTFDSAHKMLITFIYANNEDSGEYA